MNAYRVRVEFADGDAWASPRQFSHVEVLAENPLSARLLAEQMAYTPQPGKPGHIQITSTTLDYRPTVR